MDMEHLLPTFVRTAEARDLAPETVLLPAERQYVARAVEKRRREFATGRSLARQALTELGVESGPLLVAEDRSPVWPAGVVGSITHCDGFTAAAVALRTDLRGLGIDAELATPLGPELRPLICTDSETRWMRRSSPRTPVGWGKITFCAKEAVYKCFAPLVGRYIDFSEVEIEFEPERRRFRSRSTAIDPGDLRDVELIDGRFDVGNGIVLTSAVLDGE